MTLVNGGVSKVKLFKIVHPIGEVCVELGLVRREALDEILRLKRTGPLGEMLVESGKMTRTQLQEALREQLLRQMRWAARLPSNTVYGVYPGRDFLAAWKGGPRHIDPLAVVWATIAATDIDPSTMSRTLAKYEGIPLKLHPASQVARFGFSPQQRSLVNVLRVKPMQLADFTDCGIVRPADAQLVALALILTRHVDTGEGKVPLGVEQFGPASMSGHHLLDQIIHKSRGSGAPVSGQAAGGRRREILERAEAIGSLDFYDALGLPKDTPTATIQAEFFRQAKLWHPDRLEPDLADLKDKVTHVFARMTEAHQTLTNPTLRKEYDALLAGGSDDEREREQVQAALNAANNFQKVEMAVKRNEWDKALELAAKVCVEDPGQPEYESMHAWLLARGVNSNKRGDYTPMLERLTRALKSQPDNLRIRLYRARTFKMAGMVNESLRDFKAISKEDENNVEAKRELRLFKMHKNSESGEQEKSILGRLFKK